MAVSVASTAPLATARPGRTTAQSIGAYCRRNPGLVVGLVLVVALLLLLVVIWGPFESTRQPLPILGIAILLALGIELLRRMTAREFPNVQGSDTIDSIRAGYAARRHATAAAISTVRSGGHAGSGQDTRIGDLERLASLHDRGVLTDEEFRAQKTALLQPGS